MGDLDSKGNFPHGVGSLYRFSKDLTVSRQVDGLTIANGLAWSADGKTMYYIDTPTKRVDAFDYDSATGNISEYINVKCRYCVPPTLPNAKLSFSD